MPDLVIQIKRAGVHRRASPTKKVRDAPSPCDGASAQ